MADDRVFGRIDGKDLASIFANAARLAGDTPGEERTRELGKRLLEQVLDQARSRREASSDTHQALSSGSGGSAGRRLDLQGLRGKIDELIQQARETKAKSSQDVSAGGPQPEPTPDTAPRPASGRFRRPGGKLGTDTVDGLFLKGGQVKFDGYMDDVEDLLVELYDTFMTASSEGVGVFEMLDAGTLLGESVDGLESRRAGRRARKLSGSNAFPGLAQARAQRAAPSGRQPRPTSDRQPRQPSGRQPRPTSDRQPRQPPGHPRPTAGRGTPSGRQPRPPSGRQPQPQASGQPGWGWDKPAPTAPAAIQFINSGMLSVRCACNVERKIDTSVLRPWRVRCKRCKQVLFDPSATMVVGDAQVKEESTQELDRWVSGSQEHLRRLNPNETSEALRCPTHPFQPVIAACKQCNRLLCGACVDQVGDALVCSDCMRGREQDQHSAAFDPGPQSPSMSPQEVRHAFERQLLLAGMEAWLERGPRGGARMIQLVFDAQRRVFKAPLDPAMTVGNQIRFPDGRLFDVRIVRRCEAGGVACYQEVEAHQVG